ncbi:hypothetical protein [Parafrankia discariae]|uniref:hypothetical protein n=1 Tax=Parafrankia discariae TaxID=365528 RepID=UPI00055246F6|nr:hypothetical protein [Parafrankia discariae]
MRPPIWFVDTSILCNILEIPERDQERARVLDELGRRRSLDESLILPSAVVVETGNHIAQVKSGFHRRDTAIRFAKMLELVAEGKAPWSLNSSAWDGDFLRKLVDGGATGLGLVDHAVQGLGCGDLSILVEREIYRERTGLADVRIWTLDQTLGAHS